MIHKKLSMPNFCLIRLATPAYYDPRFFFCLTVDNSHLLHNSLTASGRFTQFRPSIFIPILLWQFVPFGTENFVRPKLRILAFIVV